MKELLGKHCEIKTGKLDVNAEVIGGQYPFFTCSKNHKLIDIYAFNGEYILVAGNGDLNVKYYNGKFNAYQRTYAIKPKETLDGRYLYHFLESYVGRLREQSIGGVIKYIKLGNLTEAKIPLPPLATQKKIAAILDAADKHRTSTAALIDKYTDLAQSLFLEMFGDPVTNPMGWEKKKMGNLGKIITGNTPPRAEVKYYGDYIEWIKTDNINTPKTYLTDAEEYLSKEGLAKGRSVPANSILVTCIAGSRKVLGNVAISDRKVAFNQQINAFIPNNEAVLFWFFHFKIAQEYVRGFSSGGMKGMISKGSFKTIEFINPPIALQNQFAERVQAIEVQKKQAEDALEKAEELFQRLLQDAFKGVLGTDGQEPAHSN